MGQNHSRQSDIRVSAARTGSRKGGKGSKWTGILSIPLDFHALLRAKTVESYSSAFENGARGMKHIGELYTNLKQQPSTIAPSIQVFNSSIAAVFQGKDCVELLKTFLHGTHVVAYLLEVLGESELKKVGIRIAAELEAQTGLDVPKKFASHVRSYAENEATRVYPDGLQHLYFLFHPDNNWHPEFRELVKRRPLPDNLMAMSENLDCLVVWMAFLRGYLNRSKPKISKTTMFHIIIPAYEPTWIRDPLEFPDIGLLMIHGETRKHQPLVWFNLPTVMDYPEGRLTLQYVGNMAREDSKWREVAAAGAGVAAFTATTAAVISASLVCPPAVLTFPVVAGVGSSSAAQAVHKQLSKEVPRVLGTNNLNNDSTTDDDSVVVQPRTRRVHRRKRRHGDHWEPGQR